MSQKVKPQCKISAALGARKKQSDPFLYYTAPLRHTACLLGVWPIRITHDQYKFSPVRYAYGSFLIISSSLYRMYLEPQAAPGFIHQIMRLKNLLVPLSIFLFGVTGTFKIKKLVRCLNAIWALRRFVTLSQLKSIFYWQIFLITFGCSAHILLVAVIFITQPTFLKEGVIRRYILDTYMLLSLYLVKLEFVITMNFLRNIVIGIRDEIESIEKLRLPSNLTAASNDVTQLADLYDGVMNQAEALNECFGVGIGVVTLLTVINCFTTGYFYFVITGSGLDWFLILWLISDLAQIWLVLTGAELFVKDVSLLTIATHTAMRTVNDKILFKQLKMFSFYLLHRKPRFTLCGMVPLDYTLLFTIAGAVATYMVVLVQFQKTEGNNIFYNVTEFA